MKGWWSRLFPVPDSCWFCSTPLPRYWLHSVWQQVCETCQQHFQRITIRGCNLCGRSGKVESLIPCQDCAMAGQSLTNYSVVEYSDWVKQCIWRFKYKGLERLAEPIGRMMAELLQERLAARPMVISFVPLSDERLTKRGFNQSELLAKVIGRELRSPVLSLVVRHRSTEAQSHKGRSERLLSLQGAFRLDDHIDPALLRKRSILIVDDIYTTGTTLRECSKPLLQAGIIDMSSTTFAR